MPDKNKKIILGLLKCQRKSELGRGSGAAVAPESCFCESTGQVSGPKADSEDIVSKVECEKDSQVSQTDDVKPISMIAGVGESWGTSSSTGMDGQCKGDEVKSHLRLGVEDGYDLLLRMQSIGREVDALYHKMKSLQVQGPATLPRQEEATTIQLPENRSDAELEEDF